MIPEDFFENHQIKNPESSAPSEKLPDFPDIAWGISPGVVKTPGLNIDLWVCRPGHDISQAAPCQEGKDEEGYCTSHTS